MRHATEVVLTDDANILRLKRSIEIRQFHREYKAVNDAFVKCRYQPFYIDWRRVSARHDGIVIAPYCWPMRLDDEVGWYYSWDCASGCVWNASAVKELHSLPAATDNGRNDDGKATER